MTGDSAVVLGVCAAMLLFMGTLAWVSIGDALKFRAQH